MDLSGSSLDITVTPNIFELEWLIAYLISCKMCAASYLFSVLGTTIQNAPSDLTHTENDWEFLLLDT